MSKEDVAKTAILDLLGKDENFREVVAEEIVRQAESLQAAYADGFADGQASVYVAGKSLGYLPRPERTWKLLEGETE